MIAAVLVDGDREYEVHYDTPAWVASCEWARFHGLDPMHIPGGSTIVRDAAGRRILYTEFAYDGERIPANVIVRDDELVTVDRVEQGEGAPLAFPAEVTN